MQSVASRRPEQTAPHQANTTPTVFVIDDDRSTREALEFIIRGAGWSAQAYAHPQEFLARPKTLAPSCVVLGIAVPSGSGLDLQRHLANDQTATPVICTCGDNDIPASVQAMKAGAFDVLAKPFSSDSMVYAIGLALEHSRAMLVHEAELNALRADFATLSRRERQVMALVVTGLLNKQVGHELNISEITVKAHRGSVMRKMNAASFADLIRKAAKLCAASPSTH